MHVRWRYLKVVELNDIVELSVRIIYILTYFMSFTLLLLFISHFNCASYCRVGL